VTRHGRALLIVLPIVLALAGGAAFVIVKRAGGRRPPPQVSCTLDINDLTVNLADQERPRYLTVSLALTFVGIDPKAAIAEREPQIRDSVIMALTQHTYHDLLLTEGKEALKRDLAAAVEGTLVGREVRVEAVLFTQFVMN